MTDDELINHPTRAQINLSSTEIIEFDASVREEHIAEVEVTEHPVESGIAVTDHARPKPLEITIEGVITNTPLNRQQTLSTTGRGVRQVMTTVRGNQISELLDTSTLSDAVQGQPGRAENAYKKLCDLRDNPQIVVVVTALKTYQNMIMTSLRVPRDAETGDILRFEARFKEVRQVTNATTVVATKQEKAKPKVKKGSKPTDGFTPVDPGYGEFYMRARGYGSGF